MKPDYKDIRDDQIRIVGEQGRCRPFGWGHRAAIVGAVLAVGAALAAGAAWLRSVRTEAAGTEQPEPALFEPANTPRPAGPRRIGKEVDEQTAGFTEIRDTLINDIPLKLYIPHNAIMTLHLGRMDKSEPGVVFVAQAADVRADNGGIVGAFVLGGEPKAWGLSKKGFCASIDGRVTVGVADNTSLFEEATAGGGYFFRQYPLVKDGQVVLGGPKGKSVRRAVCDRRGEVFMVETGSNESFYDFSQALADLGVDQAVYLVGSSAYGWAVDEEGRTHEFGEDKFYTGRRRMPKNTNYMVWRRKNTP